MSKSLSSESAPSHGALITMSYLTTVTYTYHAWLAEENGKAMPTIQYFNKVKYPTKPELANSAYTQTVIETPCMQLLKPFTRTNYFKNSHTIVSWNKLNIDPTNVHSLAGFMCLLMDKELICCTVTCYCLFCLVFCVYTVRYRIGISSYLSYFPVPQTCFNKKVHW